MDAIKLAQRQVRPYPPGDLKLNGQRYPVSIDGDLVVSWAHRDRRLQADQLVDQGQGSIGPEPGTAYVVQLLDAIAGAVLESTSAMPGTTHAAALKGAYRLRAEVESRRDGWVSWQKAAHTFDFKNGLLRSETSDELVTEVGDYLLME